MSNKKVSDFEIMHKIADEGRADGIAMFYDLLRANLARKGGEITFGVPADALQWTILDSHYFILFAVKKEDYKRVKDELEKSDDVIQE